MATECSVIAIVRASRPSFRNDHDKVAFAVHAAFLASGYALVATGRAAFSNPPPSGEEEVGIEGWNEFDDIYGFVYAKNEKGAKRKVMVKCLVIEDVLAVDVIDLGDDNKEPFHLQIKVKDYVSDGSTVKGNYGEMYKNLAGVVQNLKTGILDKLEPPNMLKTSSSTSHTAGRERSTNIHNTTPVEPQPYPSGLVYPPVPPSGFNDIDPGLGAGVFPQRGGFGGGGSMLVGPNDPRWFGGIDGDHPGALGGFGGIPGVPPGARFDPYGPPGVPGFEPQRFVRQPRRPGGGTHPDLEHFQGPDYI